MTSCTEISKTYIQLAAWDSTRALPLKSKDGAARKHFISTGITPLSTTKKPRNAGRRCLSICFSSLGLGRGKHFSLQVTVAAPCLFLI